MNHTEEQIMIKAKKVLKDLNPEFFKEENVEGVLFSKNRSVAGNEDKIVPSWVITIKEPIFDSSIFLTISDESGEPLYIQNKHGVKEIKKNQTGNYQTIQR